MEIGPVPGIRFVAYNKTAPAVLGPQRVLDMENYAHISDESYTPSYEASDSGMEDGFYDSGEPEEEAQTPPTGNAAEGAEAHLLNVIV